MTDILIIDGDQVFFEPNFGIAMVVVQPGNITGTGKTKVTNKNVCIEGDEKSVIVPGCVYTAGSYSVPGVGSLSIDSLDQGQKTTVMQVGKKAAILKGQTFIAKFTVTAPATTPPVASTPDPNPSYSGKGRFIPANSKILGK